MKRFFRSLGWFKGRESTGADRRGSPRYPVVENRGQLAWMEGEQVRMCAVRVLNISQGGAEIIAEGSPGLNRRAWLRLAAPSETEWVEGRVTRIKKGCTIGLMFSNSCLYALFKAATHGTILDEAGISYENAPEFDSRYWLDLPTPPRAPHRGGSDDAGAAIVIRRPGRLEPDSFVTGFQASTNHPEGQPAA